MSEPPTTGQANVEAAILESIADHVVRYDREWRYVYVNPAAERLLGRGSAELLGRSIWELYPEAVGNQYYREAHAALATQQMIRSEHYYPPFDRWFSNHFHPSADGVTVISTDITASKKAAQTDRAAAELLQLIAGALPVLISFVDNDFRYRFVNLAYERWFQRPAAQFAGMHISEALGAAAWEALAPFMRRAVAGEEVRFQKQVEYSHGGRRWIDAHYVPNRVADGRTDGFAVLVSDITARKLAEERQRETSERLKIASEAAGLGIFEWHVDADLTRWENPRMYEIFGRDPAQGPLSRAEFFGSTLHPDDVPGAHAMLEQVLRSDAPADGIYRIRRGDGQWRWVRFAGRCLRTSDGTPARLVSVVEDITERQHAQMRLRESRDVLALAMRGGRMGAWSHDFASGKIWWSSELEELFGLEPGVFPGTEQGFFDLVHEDDRLQQREIVAAAIREHRDYVSQYRFRHATRDWRWMEERGRAVYAADGTPITLYGIAIDISDRHENELRLRALNADLREADRRRNEFLATLAHELRNPLAPVRNAVSMLQHPASNAELQDFAVGMIDRQLSQMTRLVDDLLDAARITRGKVELRKDRVPIRSIVEGAIEGVRTVIDAAGHTLEVDNCVAHELVHLDPTRVTQMLHNLLQNAAKYTPPGGRIHLRCSRNEDVLEIAVRDNGIGISAAHMQQVFEMFAQVSPALERSHGGLGIGLALVKSLAELHGGSVHGQSEGPGKGSEFVIRLPVGVIDNDDTSTPPATADIPNNCRILVADDNVDAAAALAMLLRMQGHQVEVVHDGLAAVDAIVARTPEVAFLDIGMPHCNGYEAAARLRGLRAAKDCLLVALTGWGQNEDRERAYAAGFDQHLTKPVSVEAINTILGRIQRRVETNEAAQGPGPREAEFVLLPQS